YQVATEMNRIAQVFSERKQPGDRQAALDEYHKALNVLNHQQEKKWNAALASNIANTHRRIGELLVLDDRDEAQREYEAAVDARKRLYQLDPGNMNWCIGLVTDYTRLGEIFVQKQDWQKALNSYNEAARVAEVILSKTPEPTRWRKN